MKKRELGAKSLWRRNFSVAPAISSIRAVLRPRTIAFAAMTAAVVLQTTNFFENRLPSGLRRMREHSARLAAVRATLAPAAYFIDSEANVFVEEQTSELERFAAAYELFPRRVIRGNTDHGETLTVFSSTLPQGRLLLRMEKRLRPPALRSGSGSHAHPGQTTMKITQENVVITDGEWIVFPQPDGSFDWPESTRWDREVFSCDRAFSLCRQIPAGSGR